MQHKSYNMLVIPKILYNDEDTACESLRVPEVTKANCHLACVVVCCDNVAQAASVTYYRRCDHGSSSVLVMVVE